MVQAIRSIALLACITLVVGCSDERSRLAASRRPLIISVAASATELVETLSEPFTKRTGTVVKINPGPSNGLAAQIIAGAPADLFLSASKEWAEAVEQAGLSAASTLLLTNKLAIVVPRGNPANVRQPQDLLKAGVKRVALAGENVPAGRYADQALGKLKLLDRLNEEQKIVRGQDVRSALSFVERAEAEAGIVYSTDVKSANNVSSVHEFDPSLHDEIAYVLLLLKPAADDADARSFYDYLQSEAADATLQRLGFSRIVAETTH